MDMAQLMEYLETKKPAGMSLEKFANELGVTGAAFYYYKNKQRGMRIDTFRVFVEYFKKINDNEALDVLASYALGIKGKFTPSE